MRQAAGGLDQFFSGLGIPDFAGLIGMSGETAKAADFDSSPGDQGFGHVVDDDFDGGLNDDGRQVWIVGGDCLDQVGSVHALCFLCCYWQGPGEIRSGLRTPDFTKKGVRKLKLVEKNRFSRTFHDKVRILSGGTLAHEAYKAMPINGLQGSPPFRPDRTAVLTRIFWAKIDHFLADFWPKFRCTLWVARNHHFARLDNYSRQISTLQG